MSRPVRHAAARSRLGPPRPAACARGGRVAGGGRGGLLCVRAPRQKASRAARGQRHRRSAAGSGTVISSPEIEFVLPYGPMLSRRVEVTGYIAAPASPRAVGACAAKPCALVAGHHAAGAGRLAAGRDQRSAAVPVAAVAARRCRCGRSGWRGQRAAAASWACRPGWRCRTAASRAGVFLRPFRPRHHARPQAATDLRRYGAGAQWCQRRTPSSCGHCRYTARRSSLRRCAATAAAMLHAIARPQGGHRELGCWA